MDIKVYLVCTVRKKTVNILAMNIEKDNIQ